MLLLINETWVITILEWKRGTILKAVIKDQMLYFESQSLKFIQIVNIMKNIIN